MSKDKKQQPETEVDWVYLQIRQNDEQVARLERQIERLNKTNTQLVRRIERLDTGSYDV